MEATADIDKKETQHTMEQVDLPSDEQQQQSREPATDSTDLGSQSQSQPPLKVTKVPLLSLVSDLSSLSTTF